MLTTKMTKTYIVGFLLIVAAGCNALGYISAETFETIRNILIGAGLIATRSAIKKLEY